MALNYTAAIENNKNLLTNSYDDFQEIFANYRTLIRPFVALLELFDSEFPIEILNEIRAIFQHVARCYYDGKTVPTEKDIQQNIQKAKSHINRALLDCFKYSCLTLYDEYKLFMHAYRFVDLSSLDNGEFLKTLHDLKEEAKKADKEARILEGDTGDDEAVFKAYEKAFNSSVELYKYIEKHAKFAANLRRKLRITTFLSALGWVVGIVSGIHAIWEAFGDNILSFIKWLPTIIFK